MASAAAVGAASSVPALPDNLDSDEEITGHVGPLTSDEDEDDVRPRRTVEDEGLDDEEQLDDDDLFGDGDDEDQSPAARKLDDEELDSGDDEGRTDRAAQEAAEEETENRQLKVIDADLARHPIPEPSDNEVYLVSIPKFLSIEPTAWHHKTFQPPTTDHHSKGPPSQTFSAYNTALTTVRWRRSASKPSELQSNARILRWSDGSLTLQFASDPLNQYAIDGNALAPPQYNPRKPTPTSIRTKPGRPIPHYNAAQDSFTYLAAPYQSASVMRITNKITTRLAVNPVTDSNDEAIEQLQNALAAAAASRNANLNQSDGVSIMPMDVDPEAEILKAQAAAKEKVKQHRLREKHEQRERERTNRALGGRGLRTVGGLSAGDLEEGDGAGRARGAAKKPRAKTGLRRDWSDDEDYGGRSHNREDEYDEEDDFIAASDEEDMGEASEEEEEFEESEKRSRRKDTQSPKRNRATADDGDEDVVTNVARTKRRRVIDDDDDDDE